MADGARGFGISTIAARIADFDRLKSLP